MERWAVSSLVAGWLGSWTMLGAPLSQRSPHGGIAAVAVGSNSSHSRRWHLVRVLEPIVEQAVVKGSWSAQQAVLKGNRFGPLAAEEAQDGSEEGASATGPPVSSEAGTGWVLGAIAEAIAEDESDEETLAEAQCFTEAEACAKLEELLKDCLRSCPDYSGSVREAASQEIEARIGWLTALAALHGCPIWQAVVAREFCLCEDVLRSLSRSSAFA